MDVDYSLNMLTETRNKHFSERLYYADSLSLISSSAVPCHNGNISATQVTQIDTSFAFLYTYDASNRLVESREISRNQIKPSEWFQYDARGNILRLHRYSGPRLMDDLVFQYQEDGNMLKSVYEYGLDADRYAMIEYLDHHADASVIPDMQYDANGNLISDLDRGICAIHYNILNLPDTIQFINGNQIVNLYNAAGQKYKSISYTVLATAITPHYEIVHNYTFDVDTIEYFVTEYKGNIEYFYSRYDTTQRIHNATGYYTDSIYYHYIKDHLGNICAVVHSMADTLIQSTIYYASGVPMAQNAGADVPPSYYMALGMQYTKNFGRDKQPYLYNGKEFVEAHGWNTYDYGFRGYYAPIGRFTSIDPLAEQTPWQSPYSYAGNHFVNAIDWMGLSGFMSGYNLTCVNSSGEVVFHENSSNTGVYLVDDDWKEGDPLFFSMLIGREIPGIWYCKGGYSDFWLLNGDYFSGSLRSVVAVDGRGYTWQYGFYKEATDNTSSQVDKDGYFNNVFNVFTGEITALNFIGCNPLMWGGANGNVYNFTQLTGKGSFVFRNSYKQAVIRAAKGPLGKLGTTLSAISFGLALIDMEQNGVNMCNSVDAVIAGAGTLGGVAALGWFGTGAVGAFAVGAAPYVLTTVAIYGIVDFGVTICTGTSLSGWANELF